MHFQSSTDTLHLHFSFWLRCLVLTHMKGAFFGVSPKNLAIRNLRRLFDLICETGLNDNLENENTFTRLSCWFCFFVIKSSDLNPNCTAFNSKYCARKCDKSVCQLCSHVEHEMQCLAQQQPITILCKIV